MKIVSTIFSQPLNLNKLIIYWYFSVFQSFFQVLCGNMCGKNAICSVSGDKVKCHCPNGINGDPFDVCEPIHSTTETVKPQKKESGFKIAQPSILELIFKRSNVFNSEKECKHIEPTFEKKLEHKIEKPEDFHTKSVSFEDFLHHLLSWS